MVNAADNTASQNSAASTGSSGPTLKKLKKGDYLFHEGEASHSMYFLRTGMIRIFKRKGGSQIELDTIRSGQVLGELAFLDGNPRSASGEALVDCELVEISGKTFVEEMRRMPEWLKILLKAIVGRLRSASTRIRQLESANTGVDYSNKGGVGVKSTNYFYLSPLDVLKTLTAILLVASREKGSGKNVELSQALLTRYATQVMGVAAAKITTILGLLESAGQAKLTDNGEHAEISDVDFIEQLIIYLNNENLAEAGKRHDMNPRTYAVMGMIVKNLDSFAKNPETGQTIVNIAKVKELEAVASGKKEPFRMDDFAPLMAMGYCSDLDVQSADEMNTELDANEFAKAYRFQAVAMAITAVNENKRAAGAGVAA